MTINGLWDFLKKRRLVRAAGGDGMRQRLTHVRTVLIDGMVLLVSAWIGAVPQTPEK